jgi:hypothetical protein
MARGHDGRSACSRAIERRDSFDRQGSQARDRRKQRESGDDHHRRSMGNAAFCEGVTWFAAAKHGRHPGFRFRRPKITAPIVWRELVRASWRTRTISAKFILAAMPGFLSRYSRLIASVMVSSFVMQSGSIAKAISMTEDLWSSNRAAATAMQSCQALIAAAAEIVGAG